MLIVCDALHPLFNDGHPSSSAQYKYKLEAMRGLGVDRHLFGLYIVAKGLKLDPMPKLFTDKVSSTYLAISFSINAIFMSRMYIRVVRKNLQFLYPLPQVG